jgi:two-component system, OmpR family, osmolarity sensor histidine kinase EnvZ
MMVAARDPISETPETVAWYRRLRESPFVIKATQVIAEILPKGLYARALLIIITPIVVLEGVIAFAFMERHWQAVTRRLSEATARDIAAVIDVYDELPHKEKPQKIIDLAKDRLGLALDLPPPAPKRYFELLDRALSTELVRHVKLPFWIDTVGDSKNVEIRIKTDSSILRFVATRSQTYASNSHIFLLWMVGTSVILLTVAILFLRNQIRPILRLADRIRTHVDQRTTMLAGVSHDLRTVLTRFKLELALIGDTAETRSLAADVNEMQHMLEDYLAFAKGDGGEEAKPTNLRELLQEIHDESLMYGSAIELKMRKRKGDLVLPLKRQALKRAITNLVTNATRFGDQVVIRAATEGQWVRIEVDDNGPGIPASERENVFRPFYRIDHARNQDEGNSGLGLAIARDIAKSHGGEIALGQSSMGGLRAIISLPL